jgi:hypothetical protein
MSKSEGEKFAEKLNADMLLENLQLKKDIQYLLDKLAFYEGQSLYDESRYSSYRRKPNNRSE